MSVFSNLAFAAVLVVVSAIPPAWAEERLVSKVLKVAQVSLDGALWKLDYDRVDKDGDITFSADYIPDKLLSYISVHEVGLESEAIRVAAFVDMTVVGLKKRAKFFESRPCPAAYRPPTGWVCYAYEWAVTQTKPDGLTIVHVTKRGDRMISKRIKFFSPSNTQKDADLLAAFNSVELKP